MMNNTVLQTIFGTFGATCGLLVLINWLLGVKKRTSVVDRVVLITGANSGLGKACAILFFKHGCNVILAGRNITELGELQRQLQQDHKGRNSAAVLQLDLTDINNMEAKVAEAVRIFGKVDILINNAGISYRGNIMDTDIDVHQKVMLVNFFGQIALTKAMLPYMVEAGHGHVVAVSSIQGRIAIPQRSAYAASKHALQAYFDSLRAEMSNKNIQVSVISPAYIQTNLSLNAVCSDGSKYGVMDQTTAKGKSPGYVARLILQAVQTGRQEVVPAPLLYKLVIVVRVLFPNIYFWIMAKRSKSEHLKAK